MSMYEYAFQNNTDNLDGTIFNYFGRKITYKSFFLNVEKMAYALQNLGIEHGNIVTIVSMQTPETITLLYALNYLGAIANMAYLTLSAKEIAATVSKTESKALFVLDLIENKLPEIESSISVPTYMLSVKDSMPLLLKVIAGTKNGKRNKEYITYKKLLKSSHAISTKSDAKGNDIAMIVYTSGTTGEPKGVMLTNNNLNALVFQYHFTDIHFGKGESYLNIIPPFFGYGVGMMAIAICNGIESYLWLEPEAKKISQQFKKIKPNHIALGSAHVMQIIEDWNKNEKLDFLINFAGGGDCLSLGEEQKINSFLNENGAKGRFVYGYGMTECASTICTNSNYTYRAGSLGIPLPLSVVKVIDPDSKKELLYNTNGEICVCAPTVMKGYFKTQIATDEVIELDENGNRWLHTGDLGYIDEDGFVFLTGRIKRIYLAKGKGGLIYKLFPQRIEELFVKNVPDVKMCAVIAVEDEKQYYKPIAFVCIDSNKIRKKAEIIMKLENLAKQELPDYSIPKKIIILDELPITSSGKVNYKELEKMC